MPKNCRRVTLTRTVTYTATIDLPGRPEETDSNMLVLLGGAAGTTGTLAIGELLAGSNLANNGSITKGDWSITGTSVNIEPYITRPQNTLLALGTRVVSIKPPLGYEAALGKVFVVSSPGTTANSATEPNWNLNDGGTTTDGIATYYTIPKFPAISTFAVSTAVTAGQIVRPSANSTKEFLVTVGGTTGASAPTWPSFDSLGATVTSGTATMVCIAGVDVYAFQTQYQLGAVIKGSASSIGEYLVTTAGRSDTSALSASVGASVTRGTVTFKRLV